MDLAQTEVKGAQTREKEPEDSREAEWEQNGEGFLCSACGAHAPKKLAFCPNHNCDRWMTNHD